MATSFCSSVMAVHSLWQVMLCYLECYHKERQGSHGSGQALVNSRVIGRIERLTPCFLNTLGLGYQFAAVGSIVHQNARQAGRGTEVPTDWFTELETP